MSNLTQLRLAAREIFDQALRAVDPAAAVRSTVRLDNSQLTIAETTIELRERNIYSIAIGKAAFAMASALEQVLGDRLTAGIIATGASKTARTAEQPAQIASLRHSVFHGGHPEPNEESLKAAEASFDLLKTADDERALVVFSISGGGSAMIEWPISEEITLADLRRANALLIKSGASIGEINAVRRSFSAVKGGHLAARAPDCEQITLIASDVLEGEERNVASGPSLSPPENAPDALEIIERYGLRSELPQTILQAAENKGTRTETFSRYHVLLRNRDALNAATASAGQRGFASSIGRNISDGPIEEGVSKLTEELSALRVANRDGDVCLISGGEFSCPVRGDGIGGRNLETALRLAIEIDSTSGNFVALCGGTDGIDGNSPAAGAIVDNTTISRARAIGLDPKDFLERSDSYSFFVALGDVIATGPTGTNVRDVRILLKS
jgi:glycerate 2-kinase